MSSAPKQHSVDRTGCALGVVFALAIEADGFAALATHVFDTQASGIVFREGLIAERRVAWCVSGAGSQAATLATQLLIDGHRPRLIASAGFAGGLCPSISRGSIVYPTRVLRVRADMTVAETLPLTDIQPEATFPNPVMMHDPSRMTSLVSVDHVVYTAAEKLRLFNSTGALVVDMESFSVASRSHAAGLRCASVRVVSDASEQDLPPEIGRLVQPQSAMRRVGAALAAIGRRPRAAADMWRLWEHAVIDGKTLAGALERLCRFLPTDNG